MSSQGGRRGAETRPHGRGGAVRGGAGRGGALRAAARREASRRRRRGKGSAAQASRQRQRGAGGAAQARRRRRCAGGAAHGGAARGGSERGGDGRGGAVTVYKKETSPEKGGRRRESGLFRPHSHSPSESPGQRDMSPWQVVRRPPCSRTRLCASGSLARFELSAQARRRSEYLTPAASPRASAAPCWPIRRRSWSREHRASCGERMRDPSGPRARVSASSAALRSTSRQDAQARRSNGGRRRALESVTTLAFFSRGRLPSS
jgi:hypothetical protein